MLTVNRKHFYQRKLIFAHKAYSDSKTQLVFQSSAYFYGHSLICLQFSNFQMKWVRVLPINELEVEENKVQSDAISLVHVAFQAPGGQLSHGG